MEPVSSYEISYDTYAVKKKGEDRVSFENTTVGDGEPLFLALVADGHGGDQASDTISNALLPMIAAGACDASPVELERAITEAFHSLHASIRSVTNAGSTCTVVAIAPSRGSITCGNVGDSFAFGFSHGSTQADKRPIHLTTSHRLGSSEDPSQEAKRIAAAGGTLAHARSPKTGKISGPLRAWPGGLAMGRSIGDADCGDWVLATPSIRECAIPDTTIDIVLASDGIWDALDLREVYMKVTLFPPVSRSVKDLVNAAIQSKGLADDTTAIMIRIEPRVSIENSQDRSNETISSCAALSPSRRSTRLIGRSLFRRDRLTKPNSWHEEYAQDPRPDDHSVKAGVQFGPDEFERLSVKAAVDEENGSGSASDCDSSL
mmetsp:Transcript_68742/g.136201  ORF Transcript_68742/g.136201 Transcript_68742/m.136201 type:complete len:375 (-) Transcript_68742:154-1278(-)|eukprot:CAMPEP_0174720584 /NCGR_PEP_ID=MMETSP1094-20130205/33942_1 /TAXON_ID=156173 /ORGANISM="Chrysochromulina brevifilum, Strain UTEX LB 985" /LENGTH=374 /DNA_ID=CAMNT_0015921093 /DNA_START=46 /DNA_END=1170 /DNA_ORIENTATION=+